MLVKVDWLSFSVMLNERSPLDERYTESAVMDALDALNPHLREWLDISGSWKRSKGRAPYGIAWQHPSGGITIFYNVTLPHALVEISGKGCDLLFAENALELVLATTQTRATRIDIACDMLTDVRPVDFAEKRDLGRFKSHAHMISESGETYYVGSRTSNRYARVYRYNPPHERSAFLRCEHVVKSEDAKITIRAILDTSLRAVSFALGEKFGWSHEAWLPEEGDTAELASYRPERHKGKTLFWLSDTIAPMLVRLHNQGMTDIERWFDETVRSRLEENSRSERTTFPE